MIDRVRACVLALAVVTPPAAGAAQETSDAQARFVESLRLAEAGQVEEALAKALEGVELAPEDPDGLNLLGRLYEQLERFDESQDAYRRAMRADPEWAPPFLNLGTLYVKLGMYAAALAPLARAGDLTPDDPAVHAAMGAASLGSGRHDEARAAYERALELDPSNALLAVDVARARAAAGDLRGAVAATESAAALAPNDPMVHLVRGEILMSSTEPSDWVHGPAAFRRAIASARAPAVIWDSLSRAYEKLGMLEEATEALRNSIAAGRDRPEMHYRLGRLLSRQEDFIAANQAYSAVLARDPEAGAAYLARGEALVNLDRTDEAVADFRQAMRLLPTDPAPLRAAIDTLVRRGNFAEAEALLAQHLRRVRMNGPLALSIAELKLAQREDELVLRLLEAILPGAPEANRADFLRGQALTRLGRAEEGRALLEAYQERLNRDRSGEVEERRTALLRRAAVLTLRGQVLSAEGRHDEALELIDAAAELAPDDPHIWVAYAEVHEARGDDAAAAQARQRAATLEARQ